VRVILCLGAFAWDGALRALAELGVRPSRRPKFGHGAAADLPPYRLIGCYHPSQQNTFTRRLTENILDEVIEMCRAGVASGLAAQGSQARKAGDP
jgi:uracil-DNA glycosylase